MSLSRELSEALKGKPKKRPTVPDDDACLPTGGSYSGQNFTPLNSFGGGDFGPCNSFGGGDFTAPPPPPEPRYRR